MGDETDIEKLKSFLLALRDTDVIDDSPTSPSTSTGHAESSDPNSKIRGTKRKGSISAYTSKSGKGNDREKKIALLQNLLIQNAKCYKILQKLECSVSKYLLECSKEKLLFGRKIEELKIPASRIRREYSYLYKGKVVSLHKFCMAPYFKDFNGYAPLCNNDVHERKKLTYLNSFHAIKTKPWKNDQKRILEKAILSIELQRKTNDKNDNTVNLLDEQDIKESLIQIIGDGEQEFDWLKLSASYLNGVRSAHECRAIWFNYLHPKFRKSPWTEKEGIMLNALAIQHNYCDWNKIAEELGTKRSAYQCMGYYSITLCDISNVPWTDGEYRLLKSYVEQFKFRHYVCWSKVGYLMDGRTGAESLRKWQNRFAGLKKGKFSREEDILLVAGLRKFGPKWSEIAEYLPNRHSVQVRGRIQVLRSRELAKTPWTPDDDELLEDLVEKYGCGNWSKVSQHFLNHTPVQIRSRYRSLMRHRDKVTSGGIARRLSQYHKTVNDTSKIEDLWQAAVSLMGRKNVKRSLEGYEDHNAAVMDKLSKLLKHSRKRGRKAGQVNDSSLQLLFHNFFFVSYGQKGGRGKDKCSADIIPTVAYHLIVALQILDARISFPLEENSILEDCTLPDIDKNIASYFIRRKESIQGKCKTINFEESGSSLQSILDCISKLQASKSDRRAFWQSGLYSPPNHPTMVGLRTMLLNQFNLRAQKNGRTVQKVSVDENPSTSSDIISACGSSIPCIATSSNAGSASSQESSVPSTSSVASISSVISTPILASTSSVLSTTSVQLPASVGLTSSALIQPSVPLPSSSLESTSAMILSPAALPQSIRSTHSIIHSSLRSHFTLKPLKYTYSFLSKKKVAALSTALPGTVASSTTISAASSCLVSDAASVPSTSSALSSETCISYYESTVFKKMHYKESATLFRQRIKTLFAFSSLASLVNPSDMEENPVIFKNETPERLPKKKGRKRKGKGKNKKGNSNSTQNNEGNGTQKQKKPKRQYIKSGKYTSKSKPSEAARKSSRIPKKKSF